MPKIKLPQGPEFTLPVGPSPDIRFELAQLADSVEMLVYGKVSDEADYDEDYDDIPGSVTSIRIDPVEARMLAGVLNLMADAIDALVAELDDPIDDFS